MNHPSIETPSSCATDRMGQSLARQLDTPPRPLPHEIRERLRVARMQALQAQKQAWPVRSAQVQGNGALVLTGGDADRARRWPWLAALVPLLILLAALDLLVSQARDERITDIARIDAALLSDDIPPTAYADPGFMQFLMETRRVQGRDD